MEYCLCIKLKDRNLLHIVPKDHIEKAAYKEYKILGYAEDEPLAYEAAADMLRDFYRHNGEVDSLKFKERFAAWVLGEYE